MQCFSFAFNVASACFSEEYLLSKGNWNKLSELIINNADVPSALLNIINLSYSHQYSKNIKESFLIMLPDEIVDKCLYSNLSININKFKETSYYKKLKGFQLCISNP